MIETILSFFTNLLDDMYISQTLLILVYNKWI